MSKLNISKFLSVTASIIMLSSCANMQAMIEEQVQEEKEISVEQKLQVSIPIPCLLYTSPSPRDVEESRMPSSA